MNISHLEYYLTTVQCGSYSRAAKELYVTPQAVSKSIAELERELMVKLCEKEGSRLVPTPFGHIFSLRAAEIVSSFRDLEILARNQSYTQHEEGSVTLAITHSPCRGNLIKPEIFSTFEKAYPFIELKTVFRESGSCLSAVKEGLVDAAIIIGRIRERDLTCTKLYGAAPHIALSLEHPLAQRPLINLNELKKTPIAAPEDIRFSEEFITKSFHAKGVHIQYVPVHPFIKNHQAFLSEQRGGIFVFPDLTLESLYSDITIIPISPEDLAPLPFCFVCAQNSANKALPHLERYLHNMANRIRRRQM